MINDLLLSILEKVKVNINDIAIVLMIVLAAQWFIRFDVISLGSINNSLKMLIKKIRPLNAKNPDNLKKIHMMVTPRINKYVKDAWSLYFYDNTQKTALPKSTEPDEYFDTASVIAVPASRRKSEAVPGIIIVIGALFAFISVFAKIAAEETVPGASEMSSHLLSSFGIILTAVILSVAYQLADRVIYHSSVRNLYALVSLLKGKIAPCYRVTEEGICDVTVEETDPVKDTIQNFLAPAIESLRESQAQIAEALSKSQSEGVEKLLDSFIDKLGDKTGIYFDSFKEKARELDRYQTDAQRQISNILQGMLANEEKQREINEGIGEVAGSIAGYNEKMLNAQEQVTQSLSKTEEFVTMLKDILETNKELNIRLNEQREALERENAEYFDKMDRHTQKTADELNYQVEAIFSKFSELTTSTFERLESSMNKPLEMISDNVGSLLDNLDEQVRNISLYSKELSIEVKELNANLGISVKEFAGQLQGGVKGVLELFDGGLGEISQRFGVIINDIKDSADELTRVASEISIPKE